MIIFGGIMNNTIKLIIEYQKYQDSFIFDKIVLNVNNILKNRIKIKFIKNNKSIIKNLNHRLY